MSNTPELNRTDCKHRRSDSSEVRSRNLLHLTGSRILAEVWEEERPWERGGPEVSKGGPGYQMLANRHGPRRIVTTHHSKTPPDSPEVSSRTKAYHDANGGKWQPNDIHVCLVLSVRRVTDTLININRGRTKLCMHVYLVLSVRRSMETHIQTQADEKQTYTRMYTSF